MVEYKEPEIINDQTKAAERKALVKVRKAQQLYHLQGSLSRITDLMRTCSVNFLNIMLNENNLRVTFCLFLSSSCAVYLIYSLGGARLNVCQPNEYSFVVVEWPYLSSAVVMFARMRQHMFSCIPASQTNIILKLLHVQCNSSSFHFIVFLFVVH